MRKYAFQMKSIFFVLVLLLTLAWMFHSPRASQTTIGNRFAPVHVMLFEEFACVQCKRFHDEDFPVLVKRYIETGKIKMTIIPTAFLEASKIPFAGYLAASHESNLHGKAFLDYVFSFPQEQLLSFSSQELLTRYALDHADFHFGKALKYAESDEVEIKRKANQSFITGETIEMPAIFVNGRRIKKICLEEICQRIDEKISASSSYYNSDGS